jgi:hypothetical protein
MPSWFNDIWPILSTLIGAAVAYGVMKARVDGLEKKLAEVCEQVSSVRDKVEDHQMDIVTRLTRLETLVVKRNGS